MQQLQMLSVILLMLIALHTAQGQGSCQCGYEAQCVADKCTCSGGLILHSNGRDCKNATCLNGDCLKCSEDSVCVRCLKFILQENAQCVDRCNGQAEVRTDGLLQGNVCMRLGEEDDDNKVLIGVLGGVGAGLVFCLITVLLVCIYIRRTRKNVSLQNKNYKAPNMEMGKIKQFSAYDNKAYVNEMISDVKTGVIDPEVYMVQLEQLRPHTETLMTLLAQIRPKLRGMDPADPRIPTYKGVIHQLCRVLVLLHRKDGGPSIPSDALGLIEWAQQMLEDHRQQQQELQPEMVSPDVLSDLGHGRISYIDVDMDVDRLQAPAVYAEPLGSTTQSVPSASGVSPYSSVPVPMYPHGESNSLPRTFATIHRSPSVPGVVNNNSRTGFPNPPIGRQTSQTKKSRPMSAGYFANGRYYDPNPNPIPPPEVYAPASSYSDRSTAPLSTFVPNRPRSRSLSSSETYSDGDGVDGEAGSEGDIEMFPFDPRDATEPVEV